jgi:serine/threonine protein kinase
MLSAGAKLGPYEILSSLGAGGMGEVYRARDMRLDRIVALKVLPEALAADQQFRDRFEREARTISQLSHPHICALYDVGHQDGTDFLVMEYLEGETLAERLNSARPSNIESQDSGLPLDEALTIAIQIAGALDAAHRRSVVHRDLKPANIFLTRAGAKLLDFGLAKTGAVLASASGTMLATTPPNLTAQGTILGTFQYMAPEQIEGQDADARTDIFAFGVCLYEMTTGRNAFQGKTHASLMGSILKDQPPRVSTIQPVTPPALDRVVETCLAKNPDDRFQTAHDLLLQLRWIAEGGSAVGIPAPVAAQRRNRERLAWASAAVLALALVGAGVVAITHSREEPPPPARFVALPPEKVTSLDAAAISPDGRRLVFVATQDNGPNCGSGRSIRSAPRRFPAPMGRCPPSGRPTVRSSRSLPAAS